MSQIQSLIDRENQFHTEIQKLKDSYAQERDSLVSEYERRLSELRDKLANKGAIISQEVEQRLQTISQDEVSPASVSEERIHSILRKEINS